MSDPVAIRVLGPLELERAGVTTPVAGRLQRRLLTALLVAEGRTVPVDRLIGALWGEAPPRSARNTLQSHVTRLRDLLGDDGTTLVTRDGGYALDPTRVQVDATSFADDVARARGQVETDPAGAVNALTTALATWRGEAFPDVGDDVARHDAARLHRLRQDAQRVLAGAHLAAGDHAAAVDLRERLHAADPLGQEDAVALAATLAAAGRVPDALEVVRRYRARLAEELGLDPGPAVEAIERRLLGAERPGPGTARLAEPLLDGSGSSSSGGPVPPPPTGVTFGRGRDLLRIASASTAASVVTIVGPGGVGKTHLAAVVASQGRCAWLDLTRVREADHIHGAVIDAVGARPGEGRTLQDTAVAALARFRGTVVVDNCEHLLDEVADLIETVGRAGGPVRFLATSRERLDVPGEQVVRLGPLPVPDPRAASEDDPAIALFRSRLQSGGGRPTSLADAAAIVAAVDGLPLALELAAARAVTLPADVLLDQLRTQLDVLTRTRARRGDRHRALSDVIGWSHDLLPELDRVLYRRLATFTATFRARDVVAICAVEPLSPAETVPALGRLVERSMVVRVGDDRYRLLEPLRLDATARLDASGDRPTVEARQRDAVLTLAARAADTVGHGPDEAPLLRELGHALADVRAVHARAMAAGDHSTAVALVLGFHRAAYVQARLELLGWAEPLVDLPDELLSADERAHLTAVAVAAAWMAGRLDDADRLADRCRDLTIHDPLAATAFGESLGDLGLGTGALAEAREAYDSAADAATSIGAHGLVAQQRAGATLALLWLGQHDTARATAEQAMATARQVSAPTVTSLCLYALGEVLADRDPDGALAALEQARGSAASVDARLLTGLAETAEVALRGRHGDPSVALDRYAEVLPTLHEAGADGLTLTALRNLLVLLVRTGNDADALRLHDGLGGSSDTAAYGPESVRLRAALAAAHERLGTAERPTGPQRTGGEDLTSLVELAVRAVADARERTSD